MGHPRLRLQPGVPLGQRGSRTANDQRRPAVSGSSPVIRRNAIGIWRRRRTPSFWRSTSQCALAVLGEIPSRAPTSSFEHPAAISATTSRWRGVMGAVFRSVASSIMASNLLPRSRDSHSSGGVSRGVFAPTALRLSPDSPRYCCRQTGQGGDKTWLELPTVPTGGSPRVRRRNRSCSRPCRRCAGVPRRRQDIPANSDP